MEAAASCCCGLSAAAAAAAAAKTCSVRGISSIGFLPRVCPPKRRIIASSNRSSFTLPVRSSSSEPPKASPSPPRPRPSHSSSSSKTRLLSGSNRKKRREVVVVVEQKEREREGEECLPSAEEASISVGTIYQNGDPLGRRELGRCVVGWISQGMRSMASDLASAEIQGEFSELRQRLGMGGGAASNGSGSLAFVIQAQPYLYAVPMPKGLESLCFKACTHYPTLFDHFQRELRDILQGLQRQAVFVDWRSTESWKLLKEFANSAQHRAAVRKSPQAKPVHSGLGIGLEKAKTIQDNIKYYVKNMSDLLRIERDAELEFTQEELNAVPTPDEKSNSLRPIEYLVSHGQEQQEQCDTICNLNAISSSTGLGGMHLVLFRVEGNHRLPPTTLSPGDMVCVRICNSRGAGATSCTQGFVNNLGEDGCSITVALESRHGDPTFSKLFGKSVRIDRIQGLADALTYEVLEHLTDLICCFKRGKISSPPVCLMENVEYTFCSRCDSHCRLFGSNAKDYYIQLKDTDPLV